MTHANFVICTLPGRAPAVERHLAVEPGMAGLRLDGGHRLYGTLQIRESESAREVSEALRRLDPDIVAVYPIATKSAGA